MSSTVRLLPPPSSVALQTLTVNGRTYSGVPGQVVDVPDADAAVLCANSWVRVALSGTTAQRPGTSANGLYGIAAPGVYYYDSSVNKLIIYDGLKWRSPVDGSAV